MSELFPSTSMDKPSPRLEWLARHNLALGQLPEGQRFCACASVIFTGTTHSDCEHAMAEYLGITHWSTDDFKKAGVTMPEKIEATEDWG